MLVHDMLLHVSNVSVPIVPTKAEAGPMMALQAAVKPRLHWCHVCVCDMRRLRSSQEPWIHVFKNEPAVLMLRWLSTRPLLNSDFRQQLRVAFAFAHDVLSSGTWVDGEDRRRRRRRRRRDVDSTTGLALLPLTHLCFTSSHPEVRRWRSRRILARLRKGQEADACVKLHEQFRGPAALVRYSS